TYGYDTPAAPPLSHDTKRSRVPSRDQSGGPASQPKSVSLISEGSRAGAPTRRTQMSSELPGARYDATGVFAWCEWYATQRPRGEQTGRKSPRCPGRYGE